MLHSFLQFSGVDFGTPIAKETFLNKIGSHGDHSNEAHTISSFSSSVVQLYFLTTLPVSNNKHLHLETDFLVGGSTTGNLTLKYHMDCNIIKCNDSCRTHFLFNCKSHLKKLIVYKGKWNNVMTNY